MSWRTADKTSPAALARAARYRSPEYRATEKALIALVSTGRGWCWRCGRWLDPHARIQAGRRLVRAWHVGHDDLDTSVIRGPECAVCNLSAGGRKGARVANQRRKVVRGPSTTLRW